MSHKKEKFVKEKMELSNEGRKKKKK